MSFRNFLAESIILPTSDFALGYSINKHLKFLLESQWWSKSEIEYYQNERLRELIKHAYETVPYYNELFKKLRLLPSDIKTKDDLTKLPVLTKDIIKVEGVSRFLSNTISRKKLIYMSSSGSTGEPIQFYHTKHSDSFLKAAAIRSWFWMNYNLGDKYVKLSMNPRSSFIKRIQDYANNSLYISATRLEIDIFKNILEQIKSFNPKFIRCYPTPLNFLAETTKLISKFEIANLSAINTTGSTLHPNVRDNIENTFKTKIYDSYSCEGGTIFAQCERNQNYHAAEEYSISEFIRDEFSTNHASNPVRHITTDIHNYATPFIRYDTQDYIVLSNDKSCSCGRNLLLIASIMGRDSDILITPSGRYLIVENFAAYFEWITSIEQFQIYQEKLNLIRMRLVVKDSFNNKTKEQIYKYWIDYIGEDVKLIIDVVKEIPLTPSGKRRNVIRNSEVRIW